MMFPFQETRANYGPLSIPNEVAHLALMKNAKQDYKVKDRQQATRMVKKNYRAKVLSVQSAKVNGNPGYKAKLLDSDGTVFYVYIDAISGQMKRR